ARQVSGDRAVRERHAGRGRRVPGVLGMLRQPRRQARALPPRRTRFGCLAGPAALVRPGRLPRRAVRPARLRAQPAARRRARRRPRRQHHRPPDRRHRGAAPGARGRAVDHPRPVLGHDPRSGLRPGAPGTGQRAGARTGDHHVAPRGRVDHARCRADLPAGVGPVRLGGAGPAAAPPAGRRLRHASLRSRPRRPGARRAGVVCLGGRARLPHARPPTEPPLRRPGIPAPVRAPGHPLLAERGLPRGGPTAPRRADAGRHPGRAHPRPLRREQPTGDRLAPVPPVGDGRASGPRRRRPRRRRHPHRRHRRCREPVRGEL
ncbi:MAG: Proline iminopeptidase, partial [uncultured Thermomicrobiales bacterium]